MYENEFQKWYISVENELNFSRSELWNDLKKAYVAGAEMMKTKIINEPNGPISKHHKMG